MKKGGILIILVIVLAAVVFYGVRYMQIPVDTQMIELINYEEAFSSEAYIVRTEKVYHAPTTGTLYTYTKEGDRVGKNRLVATVYDGAVDEDLLQELNNLDKKIEQLEEHKSQSAIFVSDANSTESRLEKVKKDIIDATAQNDIAKISEYKEYIKQIKSGTYESDDQTIGLLRSEKAQLQLEIGYAKEDVLSENSGVFSSHVDGYEELLTPESIMDFTLEEYNALKDPGPTTVPNALVREGDQICKVADNHVWYVMTKMKQSDVEQLEKGSEVTIRFRRLPGAQTPATVEKIITEPESDDALVIFKSERYSEGVFSLRTSEIDIVLRQYEGFEIPVYALRVQDGENGVMVQRGTSEIFKKCEVVYSVPNSSSVIVRAVKDVKNPLIPGDRIVLGEKTDVADTQQ